jgi:hypothetical protein
LTARIGVRRRITGGNVSVGAAVEQGAAQRLEARAGDVRRQSGLVDAAEQFDERLERLQSGE